MSKSKRAGICSAGLFVIFVLYTLMIRIIDVAPIGPEGSLVGFSELNGAFANAFPFNNVLYTISEYGGYIAIGICFGFALIGLSQLIKRKSLKKVDKKIWILAGFYAVVVAFYAAFEVIVINYRPVILDEGLEASYPSSHTMLAVCAFLSAVIMFDTYLPNIKVRRVYKSIAVLLTIVVVFTRCFSGVHWLTDILGGLLLSTSLLLGFFAVISNNK